MRKRTAYRQLVKLGPDEQLSDHGFRMGPASAKWSAAGEGARPAPIEGPVGPVEQCRVCSDCHRAALDVSRAVSRQRNGTEHRAAPGREGSDAGQ